MIDPARDFKLGKPAAFRLRIEIKSNVQLFQKFFVEVQENLPSTSRPKDNRTKIDHEIEATYIFYRPFWSIFRPCSSLCLLK